MSWWQGFHLESNACVQPYGNLSITAAFNFPQATKIIFFLASYKVGALHSIQLKTAADKCPYPVVQGNNASQNEIWNEIDIGINATGSSSSSPGMNLHADYYNNAIGTDHLTLKPFAASTLDFTALHTFKVIWTPSSLTWLVDEMIKVKRQSHR